MLPVAIVSAALVAMLAIAPFASAASDPIASGTTTLTINSGLSKKAKKAGIKITAVKPSKIKGKKATFAVTGGEILPSTGAGTITHSGGLKIKWGKKSVTLKSLTISTTGKSITAKLGGKTVKFASLAGTSSARLGFGASVTAKKVRLTSAGAKALNQKLTPPPTKTKVKKKNGKTVVKTVKTKPPFKANMVLGASTSEVEPSTVVVAPTGSMTFTGDAGTLGKLAKAEVKIETIAPTTPSSATTFVSPLSGGTISPLGTSGQVNSSGGLKLVQNLALPGIGQPNESTAITLANIGVDLAAKTAGVEVIGESNFKEPGTGKEPLKLGNLGRSSIADITFTTSPSPATRTVTVNATGTVQAVAAEVLNGFIKVHSIKKIEELTPDEAKKAAEEAFIKEGKVLTEDEAKAIGQKRAEEKAGAEVKELEIKAGEPLGSFSFIATGE
ncbi:MAG: hypothetical protein BGO11_01675 [Solirubrobacterales bacterium 70-9]|nr:MAG: hypothetical protein BGO11_01675 [Solirubrobacterales bacterium 70-9]